MSVKIVDDPALWDCIVEESPYGLLFHRWDFLKIMEKHSGYNLLPYGVYRDEELVCIFPMFYKKIKGLKLLYSPPQQTLTYVPYLGPVMWGGYDGLRQRRREAYLNEAIDEINTEISRLSPDYTSIAMVPRFADVRPFKWNGYDIDVHYTYFIDLTEPIEAILKGFESKTRRIINANEKIGFTLKQVNDVEKFMDIMKDRLNKAGLTYFQRQGKDYIIDILKTFPDNIKMYFLYDKDEIVAIGINYLYKKRYILWMGGGVLDKNKDINEYFVWEFVKKAKLEGYSELENWGADLKRLNQFKSKFNPSLDVCFSMHKKNMVANMAQWTMGKISEVSALNFIRKKIY